MTSRDVGTTRCRMTVCQFMQSIHLFFFTPSDTLFSSCCSLLIICMVGGRDQRCCSTSGGRVGTNRARARFGSEISEFRRSHRVEERGDSPFEFRRSFSCVHRCFKFNILVQKRESRIGYRDKTHVRFSLRSCISHEELSFFLHLDKSCTVRPAVLSLIVFHCCQPCWAIS